VTRRTFRKAILLALCSISLAGSKNIMGIREVNNVTIMVFKSARGKDEVKVKCALVPRAKKADRSEEIYKSNAKNERELQELAFRGDPSKHVF
jgi:hypothetical protein